LVDERTYESVVKHLDIGDARKSSSRASKRPPRPDHRSS